MIERRELRAELRRLADDEELPERARRTIAVVLADVERRERFGLPTPTDDELRALVVAAREVARGTGGLSDVAVAALLCLVDRVTLATSAVA